MTETLPQQPQNLTLSLRISEALRNRLEDLRKLTASRKGDSVSTSEIAKRLLEAAHHERMEVVELLGKATESLLEIRKKSEAGQMLSRAQWTLLAYYVQRGSEGFSKTPPSRESFIGILKAFRAVYQLSNTRSRNDSEYFSDLGPDSWPERPLGSGSISPEVVRDAVAKLLQRLEDPASTVGPPIMAGRNLYMLLEDTEKHCSVAELNPTWLLFSVCCGAWQRAGVRRRARADPRQRLGHSFDRRSRPFTRTASRWRFRLVWTGNCRCCCVCRGRVARLIRWRRTR